MITSARSVKKSNRNIDEQFNNIEREFERLSNQHREELEEAFIKPIHDKYPFAQNGITALIASMGSGKSYNYLKMITKSEVLFDKPFYELVVICSTSSKFDKTVEIYKQLIKRSKLVCVKDDMLLVWLDKYMRRVLKYNAINEYLKTGVINDELARVFTKHAINQDTVLNVKDKFIIAEDHQNKPTISFDYNRDSGVIISCNDRLEVIHCPVAANVKNSYNIDSRTFRTERADTKRVKDSLEKKRLKYINNKLMTYGWQTYPHRCLLILDDFASHPLLRSKETEMSRLLKKLRHFNINVIICVQTVKSISKDIKRTLSDIVLFPGISYDDFQDLIKESPASVFDRKLLYNEYMKLKSPHDMFTIHIKANKIVVTESKLK